MKIFKKPKNLIYVSYLILSIFLIIVIVFSFTDIIKSQHLRDISLNLIAEIIGIFLVIFFVDNIISINKANEEKRIVRSALQQLHSPLKKQLEVLFNVFKTSIEIKPDKHYKFVSDLFDNFYFNSIKNFNFSKIASHISIFILNYPSWIGHLTHEILSFKEIANKILFKYSRHLEPEYIDMIEDIIDSDFIKFIYEVDLVESNPEMNNIFPKDFNFFANDEIQYYLKNYTELLTKLINKYNQNVEDSEKIFIDDIWWDMPPEIGSNRIG